MAQKTVKKNYKESRRSSTNSRMIPYCMNRSERLWGMQKTHGLVQESIPCQKEVLKLFFKVFKSKSGSPQDTIG